MSNTKVEEYNSWAEFGKAGQAFADTVIECDG